MRAWGFARNLGGPDVSSYEWTGHPVSVSRPVGTWRSTPTGANKRGDRRAWCSRRSRYEESRPQFIGNPAILKLSFLALVARLFGEEEVKRVETEIH